MPGSVSASAIVAPNGLVRWNTIVVLFGVLIPGIGLPASAVGCAHDREVAARITVLDVRVEHPLERVRHVVGGDPRLTGGLNLQSDLMCTVTVLPSELIVGGPEASSGTGLSLVGVNVYSGVWVAYTTR